MKDQAGEDAVRKRADLFVGAIRGALSGRKPCAFTLHERELAKGISKGLRSKSVYYKPHRDDREVFDEAKITTHPRYKESELSGDEWRTSHKVQLLHKGQPIYEKGFGRLEDAMKHLPVMTQSVVYADPKKDDGFTEYGKKRSKEGFYAADGKKCMQPGCANDSTVHYKLKKVYCDEGHGHEPEFSEIRRAFCDTHKTRGDCGMEDSDSNYATVWPAPNGKAEDAGDRAPSAFGGVIVDDGDKTQ